MRQWLGRRTEQLRVALEWWASALATRAIGAQSTVEYALVGALVVIAAATALTVLGGQVKVVFESISGALGSAPPR
jgi:Flp pilus assembly pilin Flp